MSYKWSGTRDPHSRWGTNCLNQGQKWLARGHWHVFRQCKTPPRPETLGSVLSRKWMVIPVSGHALSVSFDCRLRPAARLCLFLCLFLCLCLCLCLVLVLDPAPLPCQTHPTNPNRFRTNLCFSV